jgi:WD40 repeat protein
MRIDREMEPKASALYPSPSGRLLAIASNRQQLSLWDVESLTCVGRIDDLCDKPYVHIECLVFAPDESRLVAGLTDGSLVDWSLLGPRHHEKWAASPGSKRSINAVAFSPFGKCFVSGGDDDIVRMWVPGTHTPCGTFHGHANIITKACFSPDGSTLLTGSRDATARLWDVERFVETAVLSGHLDQIDIATFSPNGRYVLTASKDMSARLWDTSDGHTIATFLHRGAVVDARFFLDGTKVVTASYDGGVQVHPASFERFMASAAKLLADARLPAAASPVQSSA